MWKPNRTFINDKGYICIANSKHIMKRSRYKLIQLYGKNAIKGMVVHHIDLCRTNDTYNNLLICTEKEHYLLHTYKEKGWEIKYNKMVGDIYRKRMMVLKEVR